ncbi:MAG: porin [Pseudomonadota bacterium]
MKKVLLASTALVAFAGAAAAEVSISGNAEMGIVGGSAEGTIFDEDAGEFRDFDVTAPAQFFNDVDVDFDMSGETDGGLAFGASVDLDEAPNLGNELDDMGITVFISSDFGTLTMGDTDGALDFVTQDMGIGNPGSINDAETEHLGYLGAWLDGSGDGQIVRYDYTFDAFTFALSVEQHPGDGETFPLVNGGDSGAIGEDDNDITWAVGFAYQGEFGGGSWGASIGYQYSDDATLNFGGGADEGDEVTIAFATGEETAATGVGGFIDLDNGFSAAITYTYFDFEDADDADHIGIGAGYTFDAWSVHANYGVWSNDDATVDGWGISAGYDLGGGASLLFGYGDSSIDIDDSDAEFDGSNYSFGLSFAF